MSELNYRDTVLSTSTLYQKLVDQPEGVGRVLRELYEGATEAGWVAEVKLNDQTGAPIVSLAVIPADALDGWVGAQDPDAEVETEWRVVRDGDRPISCVDLEDAQMNLLPGGEIQTRKIVTNPWVKADG